MMTSSRPRDAGASFANRRQRGHANKLSISDPSHHVTEAITTMYGDDSEDSPSDSRPSSLISMAFDAGNVRDKVPTSVPVLAIPAPSSSSSSGLSSLSPNTTAAAPQDLPRLRRTTSDQPAPSSQSGPNGIRKSMTFPTRLPNNNRSSSFEGPLRSPLSPTLKDVQDDSAGSQFPLTNIENPNDIAQELSNLQALRRMSMDVGNTTTDPDLMFSSNALMSMPSIAPSGDDDGTDPSRLLWVPASVHPEIAPMEFKTFLERRVTAMKRRSSESSLSVQGVEGSGSGGGTELRRKKSMLSRQIDRGSADGYVDGAERLERKRSVNDASPMPKLTLDELVNDPTRAVQKLQHKDAQGETSMSDDLPILPMAPGMGLRRSTRTTYRKGGSLRGSNKGLPFAKRVAQQKAVGAENAELPRMDAPPGYGLNRVQSEPISENFSRPKRAVRRQQKFSQDSTGSTASASSADDAEKNVAAASEVEQQPQPHKDQQLPVRTSSISSSSSAPPVPKIVETPPPPEQDEPLVAHPTRGYPERSSSQKTNAQILGRPATDEPPPPRSSKRSVSRPLNTPQPIKHSSREQRSEQTLNDTAQHPTVLPGGGGTRTDSLTFIPTFSPEEKKDKKGKKHKEDEIESPSTTKSSWKWFKSGSDTKDKKKQQQQQQQQEEEKKAKAKAPADRGQDNARLDVIDNAISKGRESFAMDRDNIDSKLNEERKKENHKKSGESKKEKDGLFASIFGVSKKKSDKESSKKHHSHRAVSPEPSYRDLRPDVDYNWTRFPLIKERAIYRLAHMKLANPRRSLHSQVLLSNFMYSYLAKVQAMHPQMQVPQSPQQKRLEEERRRKEQEEQYFMEQQMQQDGGEQGEIDQFNFEYHRNHTQYGDNPMEEQDGEYDDGGQYFEDNQDRNGSNPHDSGYGDGYLQQGSRGYYPYDDNEDEQQQEAVQQQRGERW